MKNLFIRLYALLILTFLGLGWSLDQLYDEVIPDDGVTSELDLHRGTLLLLNSELSRLSEGDHLDYISAIAPSFGYPISLYTLENTQSKLQQFQQTLDQQQYAHLMAGGQVTVFDNERNLSWFLQRHNETNHVMVLGPIRLLGDDNTTLFSAIFLLALAVIVFIWVWPLSRGLLTLTKSAQQFGAGDFSVRVPKHIARPLQPVALRFNAMAARIQRLIRSHKELSHAVSHELRTPIARIRFAIEMAKEIKDEQKQENYFATVDKNIDELDSLVDELLTYARFDREDPSLTFRHENILTMANEVVDAFAMTESHLWFDVKTTSDQLTAVCDENAMKRVLDNLLRNAIRYAKANIRVIVESRENLIVVAVEDDGPGIPQANWETLFDPFVRLDESRDRNSGGIGLGLAIVRRYMEWHDGQAKVLNAELGGARFELSWPIQRAI